MAYSGVNPFGTVIGNDVAVAPSRAFDPPQDPSRPYDIKTASTSAQLLLRCNVAVFDRTAPRRV